MIWWEGRSGWLGAAVWALVTFALAIAGFVQLFRVRLSGTSRPSRRLDRVLARKIAIVIGVYTIAEGISALTLHALRQDAFIFPVAVGIAGVHFWAFARVLRIWEYYVTGLFDCLVVVPTVIVTSPTSMVGSMSSWVYYPLLGGGIALLITAGLMLVESRTILRRLIERPSS